MKTMLRANAVGALLVGGLFWGLAPDSPVADAAARDDLEAVRSMVKQGADVNVAQGDGRTALHWAAVNGNSEMAKLLIYAGAGVNSLTRLGAYTPLHLASQVGHAGVAKVLLDGGADANALTSTGAVSALHFAAGSGNVELITALVDRGADANRAEQQWGHTPLMFAAAKGRTAAVRTLLERGADVGITGRVIDMVQLETEDRARRRRRSEIEKVLGYVPTAPPSQPVAAQVREPTPAPARPKEPGPVIGTAAQVGGYGGMTALTLAAREGHIETTKALLDGGADINQVSAGDHTVPLLMAAINGQFDLAMMLLERGADPRMASDAGTTPLFATIDRQWTPISHGLAAPADYMKQQTTYLELMEALLEAGADVNARLNYTLWHIETGGKLLSLDWIGATPFFRATHGLDLPAMKLLVRYGADPHIPTLNTATPRRVYDSGGIRAVLGGGLGAKRMFEENDPSGLPPVPSDGPGVYPIHVASGFAYGDGFVGNIHRFVKNGWLPAVKYLVDSFGADVNTREYAGDTPLHNAAARGDNEMILYLVEKGADVMAVNRNGLTTVDMANGPVQRIEPWTETIKLLESLGAKNNHNCVSC